MERIGDMRVHLGVDKVAIAENVGKNLAPALESQGFGTVTIKNGLPERDLINTLNDNGADAAVTRTELSFTADVIREASLAVIMGACKDPKVDKEAARNAGVEVLRSDTNADAVVRLAMAKILGALTGQTRGILSTRGNQWKKKELGPERTDWRGKTLGIIGFGNIGQAVAREAQRMFPGMNVVAYNHRSESRRDYDIELGGIARGMNVNLMGSKEELLDKADVVSLHVGSHDYAGKSNKGLLTEDDLRRMASPGNSGRLRGRILINTARSDLVPDQEVLDRLLEDGTLSLYDTDVFENKIEREGVFAFPGKDANFRNAGTPHIGGSENGLAEKTADHIAGRLPEWVLNGNVHGDSPRYPHQELRGSGAQSGHLAVSITRSTAQGTLDRVAGVVRELGLDLLGQDHLPDLVPGSRAKWQFVPHVMDLNGLHGRFEESVKGLVSGFAEVNKDHPGTVVAVRFMPTAPEQRMFLHSLRGKLS